jgi:hypothetical protein
MPSSLAEKENQTGALDLSIPRSCKRFVQVAGGGGGVGEGAGLGYDMGLAVFTSTLLGRYVIFRPKIAVSIFQTFQTFEVSKIRPAVS